MLLHPIQTEKAYTQQTKNTYIFKVPAGSSKQAIAKAVEQEHKVTVVSIRTLIRKGKATKFSRGKHAYPGTTFRADKHFAYVTLKAGDKIKVFDEEPVEEAKDTKDKAKAIKATDEKESTQVKKAGLFTKRRTGNRGDK